MGNNTCMSTITEYNDYPKHKTKFGDSKYNRTLRFDNSKNQEVPIIPGEPRPKKTKYSRVREEFRHHTSLTNIGLLRSPMYSHNGKSTGVKHKPMEWWRGATFEYERVHKIVPSLTVAYDSNQK